jgi:hypothetical protein
MSSSINKSNQTNHLNLIKIANELSNANHVNNVDGIKMNVYENINLINETDDLSNCKNTQHENYLESVKNENDSIQINKTKRSIKKKSKIFLFCAKVIKIMFSSIGLVGLVFIYSTVGALMFQILEQHEELRLCEGKLSFDKLI